jgi:hypothetical protein
MKANINSLTAAEMRLEEHRSISQKRENKKKSTRENLKLNILEGK